MALGLGSWAALALPLLAFPAYFGGWWRDSTDKGRDATRREWAARLLGASALFFVVGGLIALRYSSVLLGRVATPSAADATYVISYLLLIAGALVLTWHRLPAGARMRTAADYLMILSAAVTFSWSFIIGPTFDLSRLTLLGQITNTVYAGFDLVLILCLLLLASQWRASPIRPALAFLGLAMVTILLCHTAWAYGMAHGGTDDPSPFNSLCSLAYLSAGVAGAAARLSKQPAAVTQDILASLTPATPALWRYLFPYALIPGVVVLMVFQAHLQEPMYLETGAYIAASIMIEVMFAHQFLAYRELTSYANRSARLESLAAADPVTGLPNQRSVITVLDSMVRRSAETGAPISVLFLDLDRFKSLNDRFGHAAGDRALREFAAVVRTALRAEDVFGRWGGEEFVALLPDTDSHSALGVAERVCESVSGHVFRTVGGTSVTCSIGVATWPADGRELGVLVEAADTAMYAAKQQGRNRVVVAGGTQPTAPPATPELAG